LTMENWYGVFVPAGTPSATITALEKTILEVLALPEIRKELDAAGMVGTRDRTAFQAVLKQDFAHWGPIIKKYGITAE
jgi:tripartite-type tricarboxylate transporter receptor subunit TctC